MTKILSVVSSVNVSEFVPLFVMVPLDSVTVEPVSRM